mgnify:CR=1 FL=1
MDAELAQIARALERLATVAERMAPPPDEPPAPSPPGTLKHLSERFTFLGEIRMDIEQFALTYPEHPTADVADRIVTLNIADGAALPADVPSQQIRHLAGHLAGVTDTDLTEGRDIATVGAFECPQGIAFIVSTVSVDDAGNRSEAVVQNFTAEDHTAPEAIGGAVVSPLAERTVADPV